MTRMQIDLKKLIRTNRGVDAKQFAEAMRLLDELKKRGIQRHEYGIIQPFTRHYHDTERSTD